MPTTEVPTTEVPTTQLPTLERSTDGPELHDPPDHQPQPDDQNPILSARAIVYSYDGAPALRGANLVIGRGEIVAVTGASGSGKSTLMMVAAGLLVPTAGQVTYRGREISTANEGERSKLRRTDFGILFQFGQLVPELTAVENVALPLLLGGAKRKDAAQAATTWLDRFGVADLATSRPPRMSGGQAQRVAAARAMVTEPTVLFADEPTGALDTLAGEEVLSQIVRVARNNGTSVMLITHSARVAAYGDREVVLRDGTTDADGPST